MKMKDNLLNSEKIDLAMNEAKKHHHGQMYSGKDYFDYHLMNVYKRAMKIAKKMNLSDEYIEKVGIVAILHDIVEDCGYSIKKIEKLFGWEVSQAIKAISFDKEKQTRKEYYETVFSNHLAKIVKYADASENMHNCFLDEDEKRANYYAGIVKKMKP